METQDIWNNILNFVDFLDYLNLSQINKNLNQKIKNNQNYNQVKIFYSKINLQKISILCYLKYFLQACKNPKNKIIIKYLTKKYDLSCYYIKGLYYVIESNNLDFLKWYEQEYNINYTNWIINDMIYSNKWNLALINLSEDIIYYLSTHFHDLDPVNYQDLLKTDFLICISNYPENIYNSVLNRIKENPTYQIIKWFIKKHKQDKNILLEIYNNLINKFEYVIEQKLLHDSIFEIPYIYSEKQILYLSIISQIDRKTSYYKNYTNLITDQKNIIELLPKYPNISDFNLIFKICQNNRSDYLKLLLDQTNIEIIIDILKYQESHNFDINPEMTNMILDKFGIDQICRYFPHMPFLYYYTIQNFGSKYVEYWKQIKNPIPDFDDYRAICREKNLQIFIYFTENYFNNNYKYKYSHLLISGLSIQVAEWLYYNNKLSLEDLLIKPDANLLNLIIKIIQENNYWDKLLDYQQQLIFEKSCYVSLDLAKQIYKKYPNLAIEPNIKKWLNI